MAEMTRQLEEARREAAYYQKLSQECGDRRLRESEELSSLIAQLRQVEKELERSRDELEQRVQERTLELREANERLVMEMDERHKIEQDLRKSNELLQNSEERYRLLIENAEFPVLVTALTDARVLFVNQRAALFFGVTAREAVGEYALDYWVYPETRERFIAELVKHGRVNGFEALLVTRTGDQRWVLISASLIDYIDRRASFVVFSDITERKRMEEELRAKKEELDKYFLNSLDLLCIADTDGYFHRLNPEWQRTLGYTLPELEGKRFLDFVHPDDVDATVKAVAELAAEKEVLNFVNRYRRRDGSYRWIEWRSYPVGKIIYAAARDITERKRAEDRLNRINATLLSLRYDFDENLHALTTLCGELLEADCALYSRLDGSLLCVKGLWRAPPAIKTEDRPEGHLCYEVIQGPADGVLIVRHLQETEYAKTDPNVVAYGLQTYVGHPVHFGGVKRGSLCAVYTRDYEPSEADLRVLGIVASALGQEEERARTEEKRLQLERQLLDAQKLESLGIMAGGIAHDFNNLLAAVLGNLELALLRLPQAASARSRVEQALQATCRAAQLTHQMLAYSGKGRFLIARMDLNELVRENADLIRAVVARTTNLSLHLTAEPSIIEADPGQVQQVLMNLITNASEAMEEKPGTVTLTTGVQDCDEAYLRRSRLDEKPSGGRFVYVEVSDTGCGMDEQTQQRLFDPFFTTKFLGRGLGMSAVLGIVRGHKGAIMVESATGFGTSIRVLFRACREESGGAKEVPGELLYPSNLPSESRTVLLVDDEEALREVGSAMIENLGFRTITASDGDEALLLFKQHASELACVLLDLTMPRMDGVSTFREMRRLRTDVPIILCSGFSEVEATQRFTNQGLAGFIQKPYRLQNLKDEIERALKNFGKL